MATQVRGEIISLKKLGAYQSLTVVAPGIAEQFRPGQFVSVAVGGDNSAMLLRRAFSVYDVKQRGVYGGTVEFIFSVAGAGTAWLNTRQGHDQLDLVGPLGKPFSLPREPAHCILVGGGYGSAPLFPLADALRARGCRVDVVLGAATADRLFGYLDAKRMAASLVVTTDDGTMGVRGRVSDVLPELIRRVNADVVYACGPMGMLRAVAEIGIAHGLPTQTAVEESMACGFGVCMTCVLPVYDETGATRMVRSCVEGPVFAGDKVRWDAVGTIPEGTVGAPAAVGH